MYETSAGHNSALIIDFAPKPDGSLPPEQVATAAALGAYVKACYGAPVAHTQGNTSVLSLPLSTATVIDRVLVSEDIRFGQLVRDFSVSATLANGSTTTLVNGTAIGAKFIAVFANVSVTSLTLNVTAVAATGPRTPYISDFAALACESQAVAAAAQLAEAGFTQPPREESWAAGKAARAADREAERAARAAHGHRMRVR